MRTLCGITLALVLLGGCAASTPPPADSPICSDQDPTQKDGGIGGTGNAPCPEDARAKD